MINYTMYWFIWLSYWLDIVCQGLGQKGQQQTNSSMPSYTVLPIPWLNCGIWILFLLTLVQWARDEGQLSSVNVIWMGLLDIGLLETCVPQVLELLVTRFCEYLVGNTDCNMIGPSGDRCGKMVQHLVTVSSHFIFLQKAANNNPNYHYKQFSKITIIPYLL